MKTLRTNGITDYAHRARQIAEVDFDQFDYILAMDRSNLQTVEALRGGRVAKAQVMLLGDKKFSGTGTDQVIKDPYYGGAAGFVEAFEPARRFLRNFLAETFPAVHAGAAQPAQARQDAEDGTADTGMSASPQGW